MRKNDLSPKTKTLAGLALIAAITAGFIIISQPLYLSLSKIGRVKGTESIYTPGTYTGSARGYGGPVTVTVQVTDKDIETLSAVGKEETPDIGGRALTVLSSRVLKQQTTEVDSVAGATYTSSAFKEAADEALALARGESPAEKEQAPAISAQEMNLKDGSYTWTAEEFDSNGFKNQVSVDIADGAITACSWDCIQEDGTTKSKLSMEGKYVMTETGALWHEQAQAVADYVIAHQGTENLADANGYAIDAIASVSINISPFLEGLKACLEQAAQ